MKGLLESLTGEQKKVLSLSVQGSVQIKGAAGSGKTTVALLRASHLINSHADLFVDSRVAIFTYTKALVRYLDSRRLDHGLPQGVYVSTVDQWLYRFLSDLKLIGWNSTIQDRQATEYLKKALAKEVLKYPDNEFLIRNSESDFFKDEISWLKGNRVKSNSQYFEMTRSGRGTNERVTADDRKICWGVFLAYNTELLKDKKVDFDDWSNLALDHIEQDVNFQPPFSHVVVDEAQDLSKAKLQLLAKLVDTTTKSISLIADAAQRIYKSGFSWKAVGFNVQGGRSIELKKNHRNTIEIALAARSLISHDPDFHSDEYTDSSASDRSGNKPLLAKLATRQEQTQLLVNLLKKIDLIKESAVVLHRLISGNDELVKSLKSYGFICEPVKGEKNVRMSSNGLFCSTMNSIKGLEFDTVFVCDTNAGMLPLVSGDQELDDVTVSTDRRLLYVSMTRARTRLAILCVGEPSPFYSEFERSLFHLIGYEV